jgi:signal transduction histidine kinase
MGNLTYAEWQRQRIRDQMQIRYLLVSMILLLSVVALLYGNVHSFLTHATALFYAEGGAVVVNLALFGALHFKKQSLVFVVNVLASEYLIFFTLVILVGTPDDLKYIWIFTYPLLLLFLKDTQGLYWIAALVASVLLMKINPFYSVAYSWYQISYIELCLILITALVRLYQNKIQQAEALLGEQFKQLQRYSSQLSKNEKLLLAQSRQAAMGEMIQMIAHQWRQPLSTITLQISNLHFKALLQKEEISQEEILKTLEHISDTIVYLSETVDDFQTFFRQDKVKQSIGVCTLVQRAIGFVTPRVNAHKMTLNFECKEDFKISTLVNELVQVLINLLNNAIDQLQLSNPKNPAITLHINKNAHTCTITILDNGGGIATENIESVFEPYFSTKGKNGTGIGLYMAKMIVEGHLGGNIHARNVQEGALFTILIPLEEHP